MNTLLSRRSMLNAGLPAAARVTGSASSITVRWFMAVSTRVILRVIRKLCFDALGRSGSQREQQKNR